MHVRIRSIVLATALVTLAGLPLAAQYAPGDVVVTDQNSNLPKTWPLWGITPQGKVYTITTSLSFYAWSVTPAPDNRSLWASGKGQGGYTTATIAPDGTVINFLFADLYSCIDVDGGGNAILGALTGPSVNKYVGNTLSTIYTGPPLRDIRGGGIDLTTGDFVVVDASGPAIFQVSIYGKPSVSTVLASIPRISNGAGLHADPGTGTMIGSWGSGIYRLALGSPGILTTLKTGLPLGTVGALDRDPWDGQFVIPNINTTSTQPSAVFRYDATMGVITTLAPLPTNPRVSPISATVAGSRHLCAGGDAVVGQQYSLMVSSPNEPGAFYVAALSFGVGPGIPVGGGRKVYLMPDVLFNFSLTNSGIFSNFQGVLGPKGEAIARLSIPNIGALSGLRFYAAAITINQNQISVISDTIVVTIL
jgi:hypothetical protein